MKLRRDSHEWLHCDWRQKRSQCPLSVVTILDWLDFTASRWFFSRHLPHFRFSFPTFHFSVRVPKITFLGAVSFLKASSLVHQNWKPFHSIVTKEVRNNYGARKHHYRLSTARLYQSSAITVVHRVNAAYGSISNSYELIFSAWYSGASFSYN